MVLVALRSLGSKGWDRGWETPQEAVAEVHAGMQGPERAEHPHLCSKHPAGGEGQTPQTHQGSHVPRCGETAPAPKGLAEEEGKAAPRIGDRGLGLQCEPEPSAELAGEFLSFLDGRIKSHSLLLTARGTGVEDDK